MRRDKQIEEMAKLIHEAENNRCYHFGCRECKFGYKDDELCTEKVTAEYLLDNGYRKASEIFEEIKKRLVFNTYGIATISEQTFAELKKKYTEGGE